MKYWRDLEGKTPDEKRKLLSYEKPDVVLRCLKHEDTLPVPIGQICKDLGIETQFLAPVTSVSLHPKPVIKLQKLDDHPMTRFHMAWGVAATLHSVVVTEMDFGSFRFVEFRDYALKLLIPEACLWVALKCRSSSDKNLAQFFAIPEPLMRQRLQELL